MTRSRAINNLPNDMLATYYGARADAGLLIAEGTSPSPNGLGYSRIPGLYNPEQMAAWQPVTAAVHTRGGKIFLQMMHSGRIAHPLNMPEGARIVAPSPIAAAGQMPTDTAGMQDFPLPQEIPTEEIAATIAEYAESARLAVAAGFDGVEIHAANGYLPNQFLNANANQRTDAYGGSIEGRNRFVLELTAAVAEAIGPHRTGIRLSPFGRFNDMGAYEEEEAQLAALTAALRPYGIAYLHLISYLTPAHTLDALKAAFGGPLILNGGYTADRAEEEIAAGVADLVSFGTPFIANPDFVARVFTGTALAAPDASTFYSAGAEGYIDYPETVALAATA
jgi:N-ethylmaleimide reductase